MNWFTLYLLTLLPSIGNTAAIVFFSTMIAFVFGMLAFFISAVDSRDHDERKPTFAKWSKIGFSTLIISGIIGTVVPSKNDLMFIVGGSVLIEAAQTDRVKGIADQSLAVVEKWLKDQTKEETK